MHRNMKTQKRRSRSARSERQLSLPVNPESDAFQLGAKIRELRQAGGWTLEELARSVGLSKSAISQIESGRTEPSLQTVRRLAAALKIPLASLFETRSSLDNRVVRRNARRVFRLPRNHLRYELLSPDLVNKRVEFLRVEMDPDFGKKPEPFAHEGEEYGILIQGKAEVFVDGSTYMLVEGDSIFFHATSPHYVRNAGRTKAVMIWAISPPTY